MLSAPPTIPPQFRGSWDNNNQKCKDEFSDTKTTIGADGISGIEWGCKLKKMTKSIAVSFTGEFICTTDQGKTNDTMTETLLPNGRLADGKAGQIRCK